MHVPDGYISPVMTLATGLITVPVWAIATQKVKKILNNRTIPLLAIFSALSFTIMMFNVPVPGGTTAHGVGGTLAAIILGPWAAVIMVSVALVIQALFFGDGGILAIFTNCLTMAIILPFVGYATYRVAATGSPLLSDRRAWAAGIGGYVGITVAALVVGIFLGLQPILFSEGGKPLYSPYGLEAAVPAMLIAHIFGASVVEAVITGLGVAYMQKRHPDMLESMKSVFAGEDVEQGVATRRPLWQIIAGTIAGTVVVAGCGGPADGRRRPRIGSLAPTGPTVSWPDVIGDAAIRGGAGRHPRATRVPGPARTLQARGGRVHGDCRRSRRWGSSRPGSPTARGAPRMSRHAFGYVPRGLQDLSSIFSAPLSGYDIPFLQGDTLASGRHRIRTRGHRGHPAVRRRYGRHRQPHPPVRPVVTITGARPHVSAPAESRAEGRIGWIESSLGGISASIERAVFTEEHARSAGWLQGVDPRAKLGMFLIVVLAVGFTNSVLVLIGVYVVLLAAARASRLPFDFFVKRVWLGVPFFAGLVVIPALFLVPGPRLFAIDLGPFTLALSQPAWSRARSSSSPASASASHSRCCWS